MSDVKKEELKQDEARMDKEGTPTSDIRNLTSAVKPHPDPTRYGDWEIGGKCVDF